MASVPIAVEALFDAGVPAEEIAEDVYGDDMYLFLGHITLAEAERRLRRQWWWQDGIHLEPSTFDQAWVTFDEHAPYCDAPAGTVPAEPGSSDGCGCCWKPWVVYHWRDAREGDPDAVAVTFVMIADRDIRDSLPAIPTAVPEATFTAGPRWAGQLVGGGGAR